MNAPADNAAPAEVRVEQRPVAVQRYSTCYSLCGSLFAMVLLLLVGITAANRWRHQVPSINEVSHQSLDIKEAIPDVAITISVPDMSEGELLD